MKKENNAEKSTNRESNNDNKFLQLPNDILLSIFSFFNKKDLVRAALTCKQLNEVAKNTDLQNLPWSPCDYSLPPIQCKKVIKFKEGFLGVLKADMFSDMHSTVIFELLPNSHLAAIAILNPHTSPKFQLWDIATGRQVKASAIQIRKDIGHWEVKLIGLSKDCLAISEVELDRANSIIKLWNVNSEECLQQIKVNGEIKALAKVSDRCLASATNTTMQLWNLTSGECIKTLNNCGVNINKLLVIPEKGFLISADLGWQIKNTIKIWDINTGELVKAFNDSPVKDVAWVANNLLAGIDISKDEVINIKLWNIKTRECVMIFEKVNEKGLRLTELIALSNDYLVSGGTSNSIMIWSIKNGKCVQKLGGTSLATYSPQEIALPKKMPNGDLVAYYSSGDYERSIRIWKFPELKLENLESSEIIENKNENISKCSLQ